MLINPYVDDPRQFIRFNPLNGQAYAFDLVQAFYQASEGLTAAEVEQRLWQNPANIPLQSNNLGQRLSDLQVDQTFSAWQASQGNRQSGRGAVTIEVLALNRPALTLSRRGVLNQLALGFSALDDKTATVDKLATHQFRSLAIDAFNSWRLQQQQPKSKAKAVQPVAAAKSDGQRLAPIVNHEQQAFPEWLRSCLIYFVPEQELTQADKRRLVCLSAKDRLYGGNQPQKSVYLAVDWKHDQHNVINVRSNRNVWQTSFAELSRSRPLELTNLFANNEVWVEGKYPPLAS
ncbi:MAG: hypothetical protein HRT35_37780 [Algicola sp.]|nr:hypothetical protein [Algicola sp.]